MKLLRLLLCGLAALMAQVVWADQVVPSDRVETRLRVRHDADGTSPIVGYLLPGESAKWESSVPSWYEVTLSDGTHGYVSKAWSKLVQDAATAEELLRLGGWNVKKLGHGSSKDYALVAKVINDNFDIVAVVEVMQKGGGHPGYDALIAQLGSSWAGMVTTTPRPNTNAGDAEFYAIFYRPTRIKPCDGWTSLRYLRDNDGSPTGTGQDVFSREPAFGCFIARRADGTTGFDFMLAAYHARWANGNTTEIQGEVRHVTDVFQAMGDVRPGENDRILVGDFNLSTTNLEEALGPQVRTLGSGSTLNSNGERTGNLYDHLLLFDRVATTEMVSDPEVLDVRGVTENHKAYFQTVSDHLPVRAEFRADQDDD